MFAEFKDTVTPDMVARARELGLTRHEMVTLASIIEKEGGPGDEMPLVSAVFHNRLKRGMRLQSDPTVIYGLANFNGDLTREDLSSPGPYNTYKIRGLPPGPIANPGLAAMKAALFPAEVDYLYFVSKNDGSHHFSESLREHNVAVRKYQKNRSRRDAGDAVGNTSEFPGTHHPMEPELAAPALQIDQLTVRFDGRTVIDGFSLRLGRGERAIITGDSGAGKSTVLRCVFGFVPPFEGRIAVDGEAVSAASVWSLRARMSYVTQEPQLGTGTVKDVLERPFSYRVNAGLRSGLSRIPELLDLVAASRGPAAQGHGSAFGRGEAAGRPGGGVPAGPPHHAAGRADLGARQVGPGGGGGPAVRGPGPDRTGRGSRRRRPAVVRHDGVAAGRKSGMNTADISFARLAAGYSLLLAPLAFLLWYRLPLFKDSLIAVVRMTVQLLFVGFYLQVVFEWNNFWLNAAWLLVMIAVADASIVRRRRSHDRHQVPDRHHDRDFLRHRHNRARGHLAHHEEQLQRLRRTGPRHLRVGVH